MSDVPARCPRRVVFICHSDALIDLEGLASWLAYSFDLVGIVVLEERPKAFIKRVRNELRRSGSLGLLDVLAFRAYYTIRLRKTDSEWVDAEVARLRKRYPADLNPIPRFTASSPNSDAVVRFVKSLRPDLMIARCKVLLRPEIFEIPTHGTFVFHPGICPEYRNAHGCFWALSRRDLERVGMSMLRVDRGVDTGPVYLHATYKFDENTETHNAIQHRVVTENLDPIRDALCGVCNGVRQPISTAGRTSGVWGQPRLSAYLKWKRAARSQAQ